MTGTAINWNSPDLLRLLADVTGDRSPDIVGFADDEVWSASSNGDGTFAVAHSIVLGFALSQGWRTASHPRFSVDLTGDGKADILGFGYDGVWTALNNGDGTFASPHFVLSGFAYSQGWRVENHLRLLVDLTGDGRPDIVGFGDDGVWTALNDGAGGFGEARFVVENFGFNQGWTVEDHPRFLADLTGDGRPDIIGFGNDGVWTALSNGDGTFAAPRLVLAGFDFAQGWRGAKHVRLLADITGDGRADIVGFGDDGVWTAVSNGDGTFADAHYVLANLGYNQGWTPDKHPRFLADLDGAGKASIVGFGDAGVWTALATGDGGFGEARFVLANLGVSQGWTVDQNPRFVADLNGDGKADIVGFGNDGVWTAIGAGGGDFAQANFVLADFGAISAARYGPDGTATNWNTPDLLRQVADLTNDRRADIVGFGTDAVWTALGAGDGSFASALPSPGFVYGQGWRTASHPRFSVDLTGDGKADILGFGDAGVWTALNNGDGTFAAAVFVLANFGFSQGWRVENHVRLLADLTGDGRPDIVGFGDAGVWTALNDGAGGFGEARFVIADLGVDHGWTVEDHPRLLADLTGNGKADIIGFGNDGVWTALSNGDGTFAAPRLVLAGFDFNQGWRGAKHVRLLADITGDGRADIVGFGDDGVWTAVSNGDGTFADAHYVLANLGYNQGWTPDKHPRFLADLDGAGKASIVGFGDAGVWTALATGDGGFGEARFVLANLGVSQGWTVDQNPRFVADLNGDGKADIVGFGNDGVWTAIGAGGGDFAQANFVLADFGANSALRTRVISINELQTKFDVFFNQRARPLFQIRLDNPARTFGDSTLSLAFDQPWWQDPNGRYDFGNPAFSDDLTGLNFKVLGITYNFYFQDLNSDNVTLEVVPGQTLGFEMTIHFEVAGLEIKVDGHTGHDIDITGLNIKVRFEPEVKDNAIDVFGYVDDIDSAIRSATITPETSPNGVLYTVTVRFRDQTIVSHGLAPQPLLDSIKDTLIKQFIVTDAAVDVPVWPDGTVASDLEQQFNARIYDALLSGKDSGGVLFRQALGAKLSPWLLGGDFSVVGISNDGQSLTIDYLLPADQLEPFPETPQPPMDQGLLANIDHIVVLMMENRSFDHMLGYLSLDAGAGGRGRADVDGLRSAAPYANSYGGQTYPSFLVTDPQFVHDTPPHEHELVLAQIDGGAMDGFVSEFAAQPRSDGSDPSAVMGYYDASTLDVYDALAANFLVCDRWFAAHPGPTFCNRFYMVTGRLNRGPDGNPQLNNFSGADFRPIPTKTVFDHLSDRGVPWRFYENRYCTMRLFGRYTFDDTNIIDFNDPANGFAAAAAAGTLPAVTFIDPNFVDEPDAGDNDDAAPGNLAAGQALIGGIVNTLMRSPAWGKTLFLVTYDEHGGFFDHVNPLDPAYRTTAAAVSGIDFHGVRVPAIVVSPWVDAGKASHVVFDHTSIIKTISRRFMSANPPDMGERVAAANDLSAVMLAAPRQDLPTTPSPPAPARPPGLTPATPAPESTEFKDVMRTLRSRGAPAPAST